LAVNQRWDSNADGYIYSTWYYTRDQVESEAWEAARRPEGGPTFCGSKRVVHRDVRWFDPIAPGEPKCAVIVYSLACSARRPEWGSSLEYERKQILLEEPDDLPSRNCGEKDGTIRRQPLNQPRFGATAIVSTDADCNLLPDISSGQFHLNDVNYLNVRVFVSRSFLKDFPGPINEHLAHFVGYAASLEQKIHLVFVKRPLADDGQNIFMEQTFASDGNRFCVTLTAQQGDATWRKSFKSQAIANFGGSARREPNVTNQWDASKMLQLDLAEHLGIRVSENLRSDQTKVH
jgi:hypothetical protein